MYWLAAFWAAAAVPLWIAAVLRWPVALGDPQALLSIDWHARAMVSGFAGAAIVGFLIAPARRWPLERGAMGWAIVLAWLAARALSLTPPPLSAIAPAADLAFFALAAFVLGARALRAPVPNNLLFAAAPWLLALSIVAPLQVLELISVLIAVIAGRVIPGLVNARSKARRARIRPELDRLAFTALLAAIALHALWPETVAASLASALAALLHLWRWWGWTPLAGRKDLRVAMLLFAYAWLPVWLLVRASEAWVPAGAATHALAAGLVGGMIWTMMNRTIAAAGSRPGIIERAGALALILAVIVRFGLGFAPPAWQGPLLASSTLAWSLAYLSLAARIMRASLPLS